jgi:hypothetical protein
VDGAGNVYVAGEFKDSAEFGPPGVGFVLTSAGGRETFVAKYARPPECDAGPTIVAEWESPSTTVTLDGSGSSGEGPLSYSWTHDCPAAPAGATGAMADLTFSAFAGTPIECTVNLVVADAVGQIASCEVTIRV